MFRRIAVISFLVSFFFTLVLAKVHDVASVLSRYEPIVLPYSEEAPCIDGFISDGEWDKACVFSDYFTQIEPDFGKKIAENSVMHLNYDKTNLYILFEMHQDTNILIEKKGTRDNVWDQDAAGIFIDPLGNKQEQYLIILGLSGTIIDARKYRASTSDECDYSWDGEVECAVQRYEFGYIIETKIPFSNFRRSEKNEVLWNINFFRKIQYRNSQAMFLPFSDISIESEFISMFPIVLKGIGGREKIEVMPYGIFGSTFDSLKTKRANIGVDAKIPVGASSVANFAINPDFSQLEGDPLEFDFYSRYAIYYPEYRPFFIEEKGVFRSDNAIYYSRKIQNPFLAGRYTYKDPQNQAGILFAYDEEDTLIKNSEATVGIVRYIRQYGKNSTGLMILVRQDLSVEHNNVIIATDGNVYLPFGMKYTYHFAGTGIDTGLGDISSDVGYYHHSFFTYITKSWTVLGNFFGFSPDFGNDLGYVIRVDRNYGGGYIARKFYFDTEILKKIEIGENFGLCGSWARFDDFWISARDSLEYFAITQTKINLFTNTYFYFGQRFEKTYWEGIYLERWTLNTYGQTKPNEYFFVDVSYDIGYMIDYNLLAVGRYYSEHIDFSFAPYPELSFSGGIFSRTFESDTSKQALEPSQVRNPVFTWRTICSDIGLKYNPTNEISFQVVFQQQRAKFAAGYNDTDEEQGTFENRYFGVMEYKPSIGNVIYLGGRYPEKLLFFKFTHRFIL